MSHLEFKGTKDGIIIQLSKESSIEDLIDNLRKKTDKKSFYSGASVIGTLGKKLNYLEKSKIEDILIKELQMTVESLENLDIIKEKINDKKEQIFSGLEEGNTKFVRGTLRSGRKVDFDGNIVILGDVNPGAEIIASGNIIVMGTLRGVANAGKTGNQDAYVVASKLLPTQLRIAKLITRPPDDTDYEPDLPEIAYIKDEQIVIEPYL